MNRKIFTYIIILYNLLLATTGNTYAVIDQSFPLCANPAGTVIASYNSGIHGVPGSSNTYFGKDTVYSVSENKILQCLCLDNGQGIQTNWLKVSSYPQQEISILISQGWIYIPDGSPWGLSNTQYLAKNIDYGCNSTTTSTNSNGGSNNSTDTNNSSSNSNNSSSVLATATGSVLGLATTGNAPFIVSVFFLGLSIITFGLLKKFKKN